VVEVEKVGGTTFTIHTCSGPLHLFSRGCAYGEKGKGSSHSTAQRKVPELIAVVDSQSAGDVSHKPGGRLPLLSTGPAVTLATFKRAATNFAAW